MDSGSHPRGKRRVKDQLDLSEWDHKSFSDIEAEFLKMLVSDVEAARRLVRVLKRGNLELTEVEAARKDRLIGRYYEVRSQHDKALLWTARARKAFERLGNREGVYQCMLTLFGAYLNSGRFDMARDCAMETFAAAAMSNAEKLNVHINLGCLEHRLHRYEPALTQFKAALHLLPEDPSKEGLILYNLANVLVCMNRFSDAETNYGLALDLFENQKLTIRQAYVRQALAHLYSILGQYYHSESHLKRARELYQGGGDLVGAALCDFDLFKLKIRLNEFEPALKEVDSLIDEFRDLALPYETGLVYYHAAAAAIEMNDDTLAEVFLDEAIAYFGSVENRYYLALCSMRQGILAGKHGDPNAALHYLQTARQIFVRKKLNELELECLIYICRVGSRLLTRKEYRRIRKLLAAPIGYQVRIQALLLVSDYWHAQGQLKRAIDNRFDAVMTIEESRASIMSEDLRERFFDDKTHAYEPLVEWLFHWKDPSAPKLIFKVLGLSRGRRFAEQLSKLERLPPVLNRREPTLLAIHKLKARLDQLDRKLREFTTDPNFSEEEKTALLASYDETHHNIKKLNLKMRDEERLGIYFPIDISPEEIQKHLPDGCLVVCYFLGRHHLYRVELDNKGLRNFQTPIKSTFRRDMNLLFNILANRLTGRREQIARLVESFTHMMMPQRLASNNHMVFIPHKFLQAFPFPLLQLKGKPLLETHTFNLCPNLPTLFFNLKKQGSQLKDPVFFFSSNPEDPAAPERVFLTRRYPKAVVFRRLNGSELPELAFSCDFIHFAGHCHFDRKNPGNSHLQISGERIYLSQLKTRRLNKPFINLASCQSGSMALTAGNEFYGFVVSFFAMGATNVLASLWDIDDEATGQWMELFYQNIEHGFSEAYRRACLTLMKTMTEPYYWSGFCLLGKP